MLLRICLKTTPKILLRTRQAAAATPTTQATEENNEDLIETIILEL